MFVPLPLPKQEPLPEPVEAMKESEAILGDEHNLAAFTLEDVPSLEYVQIDPKKNRVVATNSRMLVVVPLYDSCGDPFLLHGDVLERVFKIRKEFGHRVKKDINVKADESGVRISTLCKDGNTLEISHPHFEPDETAKGCWARFPNVDSVMPTEETNSAFGICLSAARLKPIVDHAVKVSESYEPKLTFRFCDAQSAVLITLDETDHTSPQGVITYVLMPMEPHKKILPPTADSDAD